MASRIFEVGKIEWDRIEVTNAISRCESVDSIYFEETKVGASLDWHNAPHRQYVITLSGRLEFETRTGARQVIEAGDVLLAEDTSGRGHRWRLIDDEPWRCVCHRVVNRYLKEHRQHPSVFLQAARY